MICREAGPKAPPFILQPSSVSLASRTGRRAAVSNAVGDVTHCAYDTEGRVAATWGATYPVAYACDDAGRMVATTTTRDPAIGLSTSRVFDLARLLPVISGVLALSGCLSNPSGFGSLVVRVPPCTDAICVELYKDKRLAESRRVCRQAPRSGRCDFERLPRGFYTVVVAPEVDSFGAQRIAATNVMVASGTEMSMRVPQGRITVTCNFTGVPAPMWWNPSIVGPIRINRVLLGGETDGVFVQYLWLLDKRPDNQWTGTLGFLDEGDYRFTVFERDTGTGGIKDVQAVTVHLTASHFNGNGVRVSF